MKKVILASQSPRRKELLGMLDIPFEIAIPDIEEHIDYDNDLVKEIEKLSYQKASAVFKTHDDCLVIGSDTIVKIGNQVLGKPKTKENAKTMLRNLSGKTHQVVTAVTVLTKEKEYTFSSITDVTFYELSDDEIEKYVETNEPLDKAGAYAIQGKGLEFVEKINGDFYTVVGLPIGKLYHVLKDQFNLWR